MFLGDDKRHLKSLKLAMTIASTVIRWQQLWHSTNLFRSAFVSQISRKDNTVELSDCSINRRNSVIIFTEMITPFCSYARKKLTSHCMKHI